jgi:serine/threonine protein kinase
LVGSKKLLAGRYALDEVIGRGGMGEVWRATDQMLAGRVVAVKLLDGPPSPPGNDGTAGQFYREGWMAAQLNHPSIATIFDAGEDDRRPFLVFEFIEGTDLRARLRQEDGGLAVSEVVDIGAQAAGALAHAHEAKVIHCDIKPANIMVDEHGQVKVCDFGIAIAADASGLTRSGILVGTPRYMSPERFMEQRPDGAADVYGLGATLFELLTGHLLNTADGPYAVAYHAIHQPPPDPAAQRRGCPRELADLILAMLRKEPSQRPSAAQVASELARLRAAGQRPVITPPTPAPVPSAATDRVDKPVPAWFLPRVPRPAREPVPVTFLFPAPERGQHNHVVQASDDAPLLTPYRLLLFRQPRQRRALAFSPDGRTLVTAAGRPRMWDLAACQELSFPAGRHPGIGEIAYDHSGTVLAMAPRQDGPVIIAGPPTAGLPLAPIAWPCGIPGTRSLTFSPDDRLLAACGGGRVAIGDVADLADGRDQADRKRQPRSYTEDVPGVRSVAFGLAGSALAVCTPGQVTLRDVSGAGLAAPGPSPRVLRAGNGMAFAEAAASPDGRLLAVAVRGSGGGPGEIRLWDLASGTVARLTDQAGQVGGLALSPDGRHLAGIGDDGLVRLWDVASRRCLLACHMASPRRLAFSPDGTLLAAAGQAIEVMHISRDRSGSGHGGPLALLADGDGYQEGTA